MSFYTWTISKPGRQTIKKVGHVDELRSYLRELDLPGIALPEFVTLGTKVSDHGTYTQKRGKLDELSVTWTKIDGY
ncbi:hypothetical protein [Rhizobium sp. Root483D2]|uniref:hypothetical protein n=1 Tax=Rhizobium sp. Root483D2 TaxID=1736545 RepID=UPI0007140176|nr:hypothetical protein [Rhizobium sp. Root483D2]KQY25943.1 hypothetical protein ASD32_26030 [Rhizobium sp. Root483D2]